MASMRHGRADAGQCCASAPRHNSLTGLQAQGRHFRAPGRRASGAQSAPGRRSGAPGRPWHPCTARRANAAAGLRRGSHRQFKQSKTRPHSERLCVGERGGSPNVCQVLLRLACATCHNSCVGTALPGNVPPSWSSRAAPRHTSSRSQQPRCRVGLVEHLWQPSSALWASEWASIVSTHIDQILPSPPTLCAVSAVACQCMDECFGSLVGDRTVLASLLSNAPGDRSD